jgi:hypothetical protein
MMKHALFVVFVISGVALSLFLGGCATFDTPFVPEHDWPNVKIVHIKVETRKEMTYLCGDPGENKVRLGCARFPTYPTDSCTIITYTNGSSDIVEHEEKHCRYGRWHN